MDTQAVVDKILKHLWDQERVSTSSYAKGCAYRGRDGTKCAIGILIPEEVYLSEMEGKGFNTICSIFKEVRDLPEIQALRVDHPIHGPLGRALQRLHDNLFLVGNFREKLRERAETCIRDYGLTVNLPKEE